MILFRKYKFWKFKNTLLLILSVAFLVYLIDVPAVKDAVHGLSGLGVFGIFLAGMFFVSTFTIAPAGVVLFYFAKEFDPFAVVIFAGVGAMCGDYLIFRFLKDKVFEELRPAFEKIAGSHLSKIFSTPYFAWLAPVLGAVIIASPLPDELGISLLGISKLKNWQFLLLSLGLNSLGILAIVLLAKAV